ADSALVDDNGHGVFKGDTSLPGGIYFLVSPAKSYLFDVLIDQQQHFSIAADSANLPASIVFTGSLENSLFQQYTTYAGTVGSSMTKANTALAEAKSKEDSNQIKTQLQSLGGLLESFRDSMTKAYPDGFMAALFRAMKDPEVPPAEEHPGGKYSAEFAYRYYKSHYWDGISFDDDRLTRTPFFENKLDRYFKDLVSPAPDSITKEVDHMILYSRASKDMYQYLMVHFVTKYISPEYMGQDAVFVHLFEKYINTGQTDFFTQEYMDYMKKRAYSLMANLIGLPASNMDMVDTSGKATPLYGVKANLVLICFWDPTCSHCKETVPRIDSIYKAKWKNLGVAIYGVMTDGGKDLWVKYIREHKLKDWIHVYQLPAKAKADEAAQRPSFRQLYDVYQTPLLYLLDKDKRIIAKKLTFEQMDEVITIKSKKDSAKPGSDKTKPGSTK
ncbi:MAG: DUF5106 domain-containing protein, partial [Chitinophagaceae bacterium]